MKLPDVEVLEAQFDSTSFTLDPNGYAFLQWLEAQMIITAHYNSTAPLNEVGTAHQRGSYTALQMVHDLLHRHEEVHVDIPDGSK